MLAKTAQIFDEEKTLPTAPFTNMRNLKFKIQPTVSLFTTVNH